MEASPAIALAPPNAALRIADIYRIDSGVELHSSAAVETPADRVHPDAMRDAASPMSSSFLSAGTTETTYVATSPTDDGCPDVGKLSIEDETETPDPAALDRRRSSACSIARRGSRPLSVSGHHPMEPKGRERYQSERGGNGISHFTTDLSTIEFAWDSVENRHVVLKKVADQKLCDNEIDILNILRTTNVPGVIRLLDTFPDEEDKNRMALVFPRLQKLSMRQVDLVDIAKRTYELLSALCSLSDLKIAHLDVCPANLMVDDRDNLVLIDFGLARQCCCEGEPHPYGRGTPGYVAPELYLHGYCSNDCKPDIYSAAIVVGWWLEPYIANCDLNLLGSRLLRHNTTTQIQSKLRQLLDAHEEPLPEIVYQAADLLYRMLHVDPADRISAADAIVHPFMLAVAGLCGNGNWAASTDAGAAALRQFQGTDWASWTSRPRSSPPSRRLGAIRIVDRYR